MGAENNWSSEDNRKAGERFWSCPRHCARACGKMAACLYLLCVSGTWLVLQAARISFEFSSMPEITSMRNCRCNLARCFFSFFPQRYENECLTVGPTNTFPPLVITEELCFATAVRFSNGFVLYLLPYIVLQLLLCYAVCYVVLYYNFLRTDCDWPQNSPQNI